MALLDQLSSSPRIDCLLLPATTAFDDLVMLLKRLADRQNFPCLKSLDLSRVVALKNKESLNRLLVSIGELSISRNLQQLILTDLPTAEIEFARVFPLTSSVREIKLSEGNALDLYSFKQLHPQRKVNWLGNGDFQDEITDYRCQKREESPLLQKYGILAKSMPDLPQEEKPAANQTVKSTPVL